MVTPPSSESENLGRKCGRKMEAVLPEQEAPVVLGLEQLVSPLLGDEAHDVTLAPGTAHVVRGQVHHPAHMFLCLLLAFLLLQLLLLPLLLPLLLCTTPTSPPA